MLRLFCDLKADHILKDLNGAPNLYANWGLPFRARAGWLLNAYRSVFLADARDDLALLSNCVYPAARDGKPA